MRRPHSFRSCGRMNRDFLFRMALNFFSFLSKKKLFQKSIVVISWVSVPSSPSVLLIQVTNDSLQRPSLKGQLKSFDSESAIIIRAEVRLAHMNWGCMLASKKTLWNEHKMLLSFWSSRPLLLPIMVDAWLSRMMKNMCLLFSLQFLIIHFACFSA